MKLCSYKRRQQNGGVHSSMTAPLVIARPDYRLLFTVLFVQTRRRFWSSWVSVALAQIYFKSPALKHFVPDRFKPSFVIFDILALWRSAMSVKVPSKITNDGLTRSGIGCFIGLRSYTDMATHSGDMKENVTGCFFSTQCINFRYYSLRWDTLKWCQQSDQMPAKIGHRSPLLIRNSYATSFFLDFALCAILFSRGAIFPEKL